MTKHKIIPNEGEVLKQAKALRATGLGWKIVGRKVGVGEEWLQRRLVPGYSESKNEQVRIRLYESRSRKKKHPERPGIRPISDADLKRMRMNAPPDDRDLTGKICGDPPFHRSALAQRRDA